MAKILALHSSVCSRVNISNVLSNHEELPISIHRSDIAHLVEFIFCTKEKQ